jgi:hypothetical protein
MMVKSSRVAMTRIPAVELSSAVSNAAFQPTSLVGFLHSRLMRFDSRNCSLAFVVWLAERVTETHEHAGEFKQW